MPVNEEFLHFIWKNRLFSLPMVLDDGTVIDVLDPGLPNPDSGPDFFNARIRIGNLVWAGNIEIHLKASDWNRHGHQLDQAYDNVILHLVLELDSEAYTSSGIKLVNARLSYPGEMYLRYKELLETDKCMPCRNELGNIDPLIRTLWMGRLGIERLEHRAKELERVLIATDGDWLETRYRQLVKSFGYKINSFPFEMLAKSVPYYIVRLHSAHLLQLEALLFGQAGLLEGNDSDEYRLVLLKEYTRMKKKYGLVPISRSLWKFLRLFPAAFPTVRIAQLAALLHAEPDIISDLLDIRHDNDCYKYFSATASGYWDRHYLFGKTSGRQQKSIGDGLKKNLLINAVAPLQFLDGKRSGNLRYRELSIDLLEHLPIL